MIYMICLLITILLLSISFIRILKVYLLKFRAIVLFVCEFKLQLTIHAFDNIFLYICLFFKDLGL